LVRIHLKKGFWKKRITDKEKEMKRIKELMKKYGRIFLRKMGKRRKVKL